MALYGTLPLVGVIFFDMFYSKCEKEVHRHGSDENRKIYCYAKKR